MKYTPNLNLKKPAKTDPVLIDDLNENADIIDQLVGTLQHQAAILKPEGGKLWHFDTSLGSTDGIALIDGSVATLRPGEGKFGGAVAVEEGTTNLIPSNRLKFEGWGAHQDASVTVEQGYSIPGITPDGATRIQTSGGTSRAKYLVSVGTGAASTPASYRVWVRNIGDKPVQVQGNAIGVSNIVYPGETKLCTGSTDAVSGTAIRQIQFNALDVDDSLDFIAYQPQIEEKPFTTSFVDGTRPDGILAYPIALKDDYTIACYRKSHTDEDYKHVVKRSDGKVFMDGVEDSEYDVGWIAGRNLILNSSFEKGLDNWTHSGNNTIKVVDYGYRGKGLECILATSGTVVPRQAPNFNVLPKGDYICQVKIKTDDHADLTGITARFASLLSLTLDPSKTIDLGEGWKQYFFTANLSSDVEVGPTNVFGFYQFKAGTVFVVDEIKLERGNKATDWTPAPEDLGYNDDCPMFSDQTGLIDELLILPYAATEEEIKGWYEAKKPFIDQDEINTIDQKLKELGDEAKTHMDAAAPHSGHETPSGAQTKVDTHAAVQASLSQLGHVNHAVLTTTLNTTWQGSSAPYTKTQTVNGLLATDTPIVDVVMSGTFATDEARLEAWGYVYRITTANNAITLYATEKPTVSLPIQLKVVR